jgi:prepilin-type N-terminal cleavage/methylation domain-containing protein
MKGFTLVELLVVIVIIFILAALAIPKLKEAAARNEKLHLPVSVHVTKDALIINRPHTDTVFIHDTVYRGKPGW